MKKRAFLLALALPAAAPPACADEQMVRLAAAQVRFDATEACCRVLLDGHELWPTDADDRH